MNEVKEVSSKFGMKPMEVLDKVGFLKHRLVIAHGILLVIVN